MIFASDNWAGASAPVAAALAAAAAGMAPAYGSDAVTRTVEARFREVFERDVAVFLVTTGTAANALSLQALMRTAGMVICHEGAHIHGDEAGAVEFFSGGRLHPVPGAAGKLDADAVASAIGRYPAGGRNGRPVAVSLTQASELGTVYRPDEISAIADTARAAGLSVHMDGARFANALVSLGVSPAEMTWRAGVDVLSFGATKNGCWCAEAVVLFDPSRAEDLRYARQRAGQMVSKSRFLAAQFEAYLHGDHWLDNARHANAMARRLADGIVAGRFGRLNTPCEANEVFAILPDAARRRAEAAGARIYPWPPTGDAEVREGETLMRLVASFATSAEDVDRFLAILGDG
jgi:threonine aldolase